MSVKNVEDAYPLSPMQEGLLFHGLYRPEEGLYVTQFTSEIRNLDVEAIRRAWQTIIDRYPAFRTAFVWKNVEKPLQVVQRRVELPFQLEDWRGLSASEQLERLDAYVDADRRHGFQLNKAPLLRLALFRVRDDTHQLVLSHHHIVVDGWSMALVFKEAFALYEAYSEGLELQFPPVRSYREYIAWLQQQDLSKAEEFWRETLKGFTTPTPFVVDRISSDSREQKDLYPEQQLRLSTSTTSALQRLTRQHQLTMNTIVQGAWAVLLSKYSGEQDVVFGSVIAGRPAVLPGIETMVGLFINTLPVRVRIAPETELIEWLQDLQNRQSDARQFEYSPLAQVQGWSDVPRGVPLFSSIVAFQNFPVTAPKGRGNREIGTLRAVEAQNYPLALSASSGSELSLILRYDPRLFEMATIQRLLGHLQTLLDAIATQSDRRLAELPLLTEVEKQQILNEWNNTATNLPQRQTIHELFEEQTARTPGAIAAVCNGEQVTYDELNTRANQLAWYLRGLGVGPEVPVGICMQRGIEMLTGLLGILKAGGAYVPIDHQQPIERIAFMVDDAKMTLLLTQERLLEKLSPLDQVLCLDTQWAEIKKQRNENLKVSTGGDALAYVMYTSGSTGLPKGTSVPHRAVVRLVKETEFASFDAKDVFLQLAPVSFDASTFELWGALLNGARLVIMPPETPSLVELGEVLRREGVTTLWLTAGLFHLMVDERLEDLKGVRQLLAGGDVLSVGHVERYLAAAGSDAVLINGYGPTENTTFSCTHRMNRGWTSGGNTVPIGRPIANTQAYVLDNQGLELVPIGVAGELYVGGEGLARDYLRQPQLTAQKFVPNPFSSKPGARLYRTGDQVQWLTDGTIEFLGRIDQQVKIRGFRVELGEIETVLNQHESVRETVVVARAEENGARRLVAYIVSAAESNLNELRSYLQQRLPDYMVPVQYVFLSELPLTVNGKVDRRALPDPDTERPESEKEFCGPRTPAEEMLASIWSEVLRVNQIGIYDTFFELGGESILAIKLVSRINKDFDIELPVRALFEQPTIAELATHIVQHQAERADEAELLKLLEELGDVSEDEARSLITT